MKFVNVTVKKKTKDWNMVEKAKGIITTAIRRFPFKIKINNIYLFDDKKSFERLPDKKVRNMLLRRVVDAFFDGNKNDFYLSVYNVVGDTFNTYHEFAHAFDYQHNMISTKKLFVDAFKKDKGKWHEDPLISGPRANRPYEFFADFVAIFVEEGKGSAKEMYPNYYKVFVQYLKNYFKK